MQTPRTFLAYAPRGPALRCAVAYIERGQDVAGWYAGNGLSGAESAYFILDDFHTPREARLRSVPDIELHSRWTTDEGLIHDLAHLQEVFMKEWLFHRGEDGAALQLARYADAGLATGILNVRYERLARFSKEQPTWTCWSRDFERGVLVPLSRRWPLDYRMVRVAA